MTAHWNIGRDGRAWSGNELAERRRLLPDKIEVWEGRLFFDDEERLAMLAILLENVGIDRAIRLDDPGQWRAALEALRG